MPEVHPIYRLYRNSPPTRGRGVTVQVAYWDGYDGRDRKYSRGSAAWWAQKAGKDNRRDAGGVRHQCPNCYYASDTETVCPARCCNGQKMLPKPDALLDSEIFTRESWENQHAAMGGVQ